MTRRGRVLLASSGVAIALVTPLLSPHVASAHPLGNLAVNTYTGIVVHESSISIDSVLDLAELPALQARQSIDGNGDSNVDEAESDAYRSSQCNALGAGLVVEADARPIALTLRTSSLAFPPGQASLPTLRLECSFTAPIATERAHTIAVDDRNFPDRIGWREMTAIGDGTTLSTTLPATSSSDRLAAYPTNASPRRVLHATVEARPGGASLADGSATDAGRTREPIGRGNDALTRKLGDLVGNERLTVGLALVAAAIALALGALHALAPGHGKSIMAAYVVGEQGSTRQVLTIGVTVALTHTAGVLALGSLIWASDAFAPDRALPWLTFASGLFLVATGAALFVRRVVLGRSFGHHHGPHDHHGGSHDHHGGSHDHGAHHDDHEHHHGHGRHNHQHGDRTPSSGWLVLMGIAGGLVPTPSALVVLLGANALGHTWFGVVLVALYGVGMSSTLMGVGLVLVRLESWLQRHWRDARWMRLTLRFAPVFTATALVFAGLTVALRGASAV